MSQNYTVIANNRTGTIQLSQNMPRLNLPDVEEETNYTDAHPSYFMAAAASSKNPHLSKLLWKSAGIVAQNGIRWATAEEATAGTIDNSDEAHNMIPKKTNPVAFVTGSDPENPYTVYTIKWYEPAVSGPRPDHKHTFGCTCPFYTKGNSRRPSVFNGSQPICKHILATTSLWIYEKQPEKQEKRKADAIQSHNEMLQRYQPPTRSVSGLNTFQQWERDKYIDAEGARSYIKAALANGATLGDIPQHILNRLPPESIGTMNPEKKPSYLMNDPRF